MRTKYIARLGGIAAVIAATLMWPVSASAQPRVFDPPGPGAVGAAAADRTAPAPASMTATSAGSGLTRQLAQARLATAKYATNLARAKADGYQVITPMMPDMGIHYMNPGIGGFTITKPQILVYEHHGNTWQLGALEWVFPSMPKTPPLQDATFGLFPAACHYRDGTFIPDENSKTCQKTNPKTGSTFSFWHPDLTTMHVWIWYPNPAGLYSSTNPLIAPFNGG
jgi:hypothetical protein